MTIKHFRCLRKGLALLACSVSACLFADNSNKEIDNTDLPYAIYMYGSKNFTATDSNGDVVVSENPHYDFSKMKLYAEVFLRTRNYHYADVFKKIANHFENPDKFFERTITKNKYLGKVDDALRDYLFNAGEQFVANDNSIVEMANTDKTFDALETDNVPDGFNERGSTAMQRSLYYQGFNPEFCMPSTYGNKIGGLDFSPLNMTPVDADLKRAIYPRDAKKAFEYAQLTSTLFDSSNFANLCLNGIGTEKNAELAVAIFSQSVFWNAGAEEISSYKNFEVSKKSIRSDWDSRTYFMPLYAYMLYHGIGVEKDIAKCNAILSLPVYSKAWKNFYCGYLVPKDFDFAIYCLERSKEFWAPTALTKIYSGEYLQEHANPSKAAYWREIADLKTAEFIKSFNEEERHVIESKKDISLFRAVVLYGSKERILQRYDNLTFDNTFFDEARIDKLLNKFENKDDLTDSVRVLSALIRALSVGDFDTGKADSQLLSKLEKSKQVCEEKLAAATQKIE